MSALHRTERRVLYTTMSLISIFVFSILYAKYRYRTDLPECIRFDKAFVGPAVDTIDNRTYQVFAVASMWQFEPANLTFPAGSEVDFYLTSKDVVHGFNIYPKNVNMMAVYGNINKTTVKFEKAGIYTITCHEYCGVGHQFMQSQITIK